MVEVERRSDGAAVRPDARRELGGKVPVDARREPHVDAVGLAAQADLGDAVVLDELEHLAP